MRELRLFGAGGEFEALKMVVDRAFLKETEMRFGLCVFRNAACCLAPMIQNLGNVTDARIALTQAQHELEVLYPIEGRIESCLDSKVAPHTKQMTYIHDAAKILRRPIRLEKWFDQVSRFIFDLVFVRVNHVIAFG